MNIDLTKGSPAKVLARFSLPIILGCFFQQAYYMVDTAVVGRFLGYEALAGVGAVNGLNFIIYGFATGITSGAGIFIAQCFGARRDLRKGVASSLLISAGLSVLLTVIPLLLCRWTLTVMQTPAEIIDYSQRYFSIYLLGSVAMVAYNMATCILRAIGDSRAPLLFLILSSVLNIALDFLMIGGLEMDVEGAAWATVISQGIAAVLCFIYAFRRYPSIRLRGADFRVGWSCAREQLRIGVPMALQFSITGIGLVLLQVALNGFAPDYIAGFTTANRIQNVGSLVAIAFGIAMANYAGQNFGAGKMDRVRQGVRSSLLITMAVCVLCGAVMIIFARPLTCTFVSNPSNDLIEASRKYLFTSAVFFPFLYAILVFRNALQGIGKAFWPLMAGVLEMVIRSVSSFVLPGWMGYNGIVLIDPAAWIGAAVMLLIVYCRAVSRVQRC